MTGGEGDESAPESSEFRLHSLLLPQAKSGLKGVQSILLYKASREGRGRHKGGGGSQGSKGGHLTHPTRTLLIGCGVLHAKRGLPEGHQPCQPLRALTATPSHHPAFWTGQQPCSEVPSSPTHPDPQILRFQTLFLSPPISLQNRPLRPSRRFRLEEGSPETPRQG